MSCTPCSELRLVWPIRSPGELLKAVNIVRQNVDDGTIREVARGSGPGFDDLSPDGLWEDHLNYKFQCRWCGETFSLIAETYHGGGGEWRAESCA